MFGKKFWILWILICCFIAYSKLTKQTISKDAHGDFGVKYSITEQASKKLEAIERFSESCKSLGVMREGECLKKESEFSECLEIEDFQYVEKFEVAVTKCMGVKATKK
jgi:hypothetical protein